MANPNDLSSPRSPGSVEADYDLRRPTARPGRRVLHHRRQLHKCWSKNTADDLSLYMLLVLASGLALWIMYGVMQGDWVIIAANSAGLALLGMIIGFTIREMIAACRRGCTGGEGEA